MHLIFSLLLWFSYAVADDCNPNLTPQSTPLKGLWKPPALRPPMCPVAKQVRENQNWDKLDSFVSGTGAVKGSLLAGSSTNVLGVLPVGTNNQCLTADSAQTLGVKWATCAAGSSIDTAANYFWSGQHQFANGIEIRDQTTAPGDLISIIRNDPAQGFTTTCANLPPSYVDKFTLIHDNVLDVFVLCQGTQTKLRFPPAGGTTIFPTVATGSKTVVLRDTVPSVGQCARWASTTELDSVACATASGVTVPFMGVPNPGSLTADVVNGTDFVPAPPSANARTNKAVCTNFVSPYNGTFSRMATIVSAGASGKKCSIGVANTPGNGGTLLGQVTGDCNIHGQILSATGLSITLVAGTTYAFCFGLPDDSTSSLASTGGTVQLNNFVNLTSQYLTTGYNNTTGVLPATINETGGAITVKSAVAILSN